VVFGSVVVGVVDVFGFVVVEVVVVVVVPGVVVHSTCDISLQSDPEPMRSILTTAVPRPDTV
jgi:hypothetical protein